jgi:hypothetical protein
MFLELNETKVIHFSRQRITSGEVLLVIKYQNDSNSGFSIGVKFTSKFEVKNNFISTDMNQEEAYELLKDCVREIQKRLIINMPSFQVRIFDLSSWSVSTNIF